MSGELVTLTASEFTAAVHVGLMRQHAAIERRAATRNNLDPARDARPEWATDLEIHICGALGELAFGKWRGRVWNHSVEYDTDAPDYVDGGREIEVRGTAYRTGRLPILRKDKPERCYVLVIVTPPTCRIVGWMRGDEARRDEWLGSLKPGAAPSWNVPQSELHPFRVKGIGR